MTPGGWTQPQIDFDIPDDAAAVYGQAEVIRFTGASKRQLDNWARERILSPSVQEAAGQGTRRLYSFRDIVVIRVIKRLTDAGIRLNKVSCAIETVRRLGDADLAATVLVSDGVTVYECRSDNEVIDLLRGGQLVFAITISHALADLRAVLAAPAPTGSISARRRGADAGPTLTSVTG
jgi:DNA-binding transcriptional MerR regulator